MKTVLVSGAATGVGLAAVQALQAEGFSVLAAVLPGQDLSGLSGLGVHKVIEADLARDADIDRLVETVRQNGRLDCIVSNAGIAVPGPLEMVPADDLRLQFQINTFAPVCIIRGLLPLLRESHGRVVMIGAGQARASLPCGGPYGASKAASSALMDALRAEVSSFGVQVCVVEPGAIKTGILKSSEEKWAQLLAQAPAGLDGRVLAVYAASMQSTFGTSKKAFESAIPPAEFAKTLVGIINREKLKPRYLVGREARVMALVARLPDRARAALMRKMMNG